MPENFLSTFKDPAKIKLGGFLWGAGRRVKNSAVQNVRGMSGKDKVVGTVNTGLGITGGVLGGYATALAVGAGSATFFMALPVTGAAAGLAAFGAFTYLTVNSMCSNRDAAHEKLAPFVWSLIDDVGPAEDKGIYGNDRKLLKNGTATYNAKGNLKEAGAAAIYLVTQSQSQYSDMARKFETTNKKFVEFHNKWFINKLPATDSLYGQLQKAFAPLDFTVSPPIAAHTPGTGSLYQDAYAFSHDSINIMVFKGIKPIWKPSATYAEIAQTWTPTQKKLLKEIVTELGKATKQDGAVFEYMRCLLQLGNYLQSPLITHMVTFAQLNEQRGEIIKKAPARPHTLKGVPVQQGNEYIDDPHGIGGKDMLGYWDQTDAIRAQVKEVADALGEAQIFMNFLYKMLV
ncbi:MAG: hypothetical protein RLZZ419_689 [Pseudomonadota bacterium]